MPLDRPLDISSFVVEGKNEIEIFHFRAEANLAVCLKVAQPTPEQVVHSLRRRRFVDLVRSDAFARSPASA